MRTKGGVNIGKRYTSEEWAQVLKLDEEIGGEVAARRLEIKEDALYGLCVWERKRTATLECAVGGRSEAELIAENVCLRTQL